MRTDIAVTCLILSFTSTVAFAQDVDFNRDVRPILSNKCILCHGPDTEGLQAGLRLDLRDVAIGELESGTTAIVPGKPEASEMLMRVSSTDPDLRMPPPEHGAALTAAEVDVLTRWIQQGAHYAQHWAYVKPQRPDVPEATGEFSSWPKNAVDNFVLQKMVTHGLQPAPEADRYALARRVFLDLIGLPPTIEEVDAFVADTSADAYEKLVEDLLNRPAFGEHWARKWLDLARYADSAGYADDPPRTIWAYRDWVVQSINNNMPFDQFTREQLAGDLLPNPTESQLIATAFHRNTLTNNEGGTQDEEFRNVAVVDRVNTTMAVWMGTTMACAQCHTHKYDPLTQEEYFQMFAILNNTQDADRRDESPLLQIYSDAQKQQKIDLEKQIADLTTVLATPTPELAESQLKWEQKLAEPPAWQLLKPSVVKRSSDQPTQLLDDGSVLIPTPAAKDTYTVDIPLQADVVANLKLATALRLDTLPHDSLPGKGSGHGGGNFVITGLNVQLVPEGQQAPQAKFVRVINNGQAQMLSLAEVQVFSGGTNVALKGKATQHSTAYAGPPEYAIDGNTDGDYQNKSVTHTDTVDDPWWEVDLGGLQAIDRVLVWNRTDNGLHTRLKDFSVQLLDADRAIVWQTQVAASPNPTAEFSPSNIRDIKFRSAFADYHQPDFEPADVLKGNAGAKDGWAIGGATTEAHQLVLVPEKALIFDQPVTLRVTIAQNSTHENHLLGHFRLSVTSVESAVERSQVPGAQLAILEKPVAERMSSEVAELAKWYRENAAPELQPQRTELRKAVQSLEGLKPAVSVPILREIAGQPRETHLQHRGNYLDKGQVVEPGLPEVFHAAPEREKLDRLALADWLVSPDNPLTGRVLANRYWETIFGRGIVPTSEEFGSQGELPTHPELLDWLATDILLHKWDTRHLLRTLVTSATYRQSARFPTGEKVVDPDNRWLARGPRVRLSAEMVRDQALLVSGLLSEKMFGPPVRPPQPNLGLTAAFGSSTDWKTSEGEDRYRRGLYTTWRRSNPYPSMATFDAPNREVCTVKRNSTNTPLQSLVTLNDPAYVEAAQSLARLALQQDGTVSDQIQFAFRRCILRPPTQAEQQALTTLFEDSERELKGKPEEALKLATDPLGPVPDGMDAVAAASMTVVCNILLNLDEMFLKR